MASRAPYLLGLRTVPERLPSESGFPFNLPYVPELDLEFGQPITFFVGENGTGKSTLIEAVAALCGLPVCGGGPDELAAGSKTDQDCALSYVLRPSFRRRPRDGYFLRAEFQAQFASLLDDRRADTDFLGNPYARYGGKSLHAQSHGEAFLSVLQNRVGEGLFLLDEPESALSPQRQLALLALMHELVKSGDSQFLIATHSPVLMTYPGAEIFSFDETPLRVVPLENTPHYQITRGILENPGNYWKYLKE